MIRLLGSLAGIMLVSAMLLLVVDIRIYSNRGWHREKKYARVVAWSYILLSLMICIGLLLYI
ncbi:CLC_0170 family protein [Paenibacillus sp. FSL H7-0756]|uniref:CLC_0170 family protein n=1 Tax=unclassified Paenibacillus TaxID=185978 RepID=UPI0030FC7C16